MITLDQIVFNKKGQKGTITRIITKSTGYVEVTMEDGTVKKEMAFNLTDESGKSLKKAPVRKESTTPVNPLDKAIGEMKWVNGFTKGDRCGVGFVVYGKMIARIESKAQETGNDFIANLCDSVLHYMSCSDKQAYCLAKFVVDNNIDIYNVI